MEKWTLLKKYKEKYGDCRVPRPETTNLELKPWGEQLGNWVKSQRKLKSLGKLTAEREAKLNELDFEWVLVEKNGHDTTREDNLWMDKYQELIAFKKAFGHCMVAASDKDYKTLGVWVSTQRQLYRDDRLKLKRQEWLDALGFVWEIDRGDATKSKNQMAWEQSYSDLVKYKAKHGNIDLPHENTGLGKWFHVQMREAREGILDPRRLAKLKEIGMTSFEKVTEQSWKASYKALKRYKKEHGRLFVPTTENMELSTWISEQRRMNRKGT